MSRGIFSEVEYSCAIYLEETPGDKSITVRPKTEPNAPANKNFPRFFCLGFAVTAHINPVKCKPSQPMAKDSWQVVIAKLRIPLMINNDADI